MILAGVYRAAEGWMRTQGFHRESHGGVSAFAGGYGPPMVLLHGALSRGATTWSRAAGRLARHFHVIAPDLPGFGASSGALSVDEVTVRRMAERLLETLPAWTKGSRFSVVGESLGGWVAAWMALCAPGSVGRLYLVDAAGRWSDEEAARSLGPLITPESPEMLNTLCRKVTGRTVTLPGWAARDVIRTYRREYPALRHLIETAEEDVLVDAELRAIMCPVRVIWGERDAMIPLSEGRALAAAIPGAEMEVLPCAHVPPIELPDRFVAAVVKGW